jgi:hypothetical protein
MKKFLYSRNGACRGAALIIVLAFVVLATVVGLTYFSRTTTDRQLAQSSYNDTSADLLARSALDITVSDLKREIATNQPITAANIQPQRYGDNISIPNLIRRSFSGDPTGRTSNVSSGAASANGRIITLDRWNSHYLIPSTPTFTAPDWVLVTGQGPQPAPVPNVVIGRYAFAVYDEGGLMDMNLGGYPNYASLSRPTLPARPFRRLPAKLPSEESEIILAAFTPEDNCQPPNFTPQVTNVTLATGVPCSLLFNTNHDPTYFTVNGLPRGLTINTSNGNIYGTPSTPGDYTVTQTCSNGCLPDGTGTLHLTIVGFPSPETTPWPVNLARKGTVAFADLTALPSNPASTQIDKLMGWRNYATTRQTGASFDNPSFILASADNYARYFLGAIAPFGTPFTTVPVAVQNGRTDQAVMTRQELIRLQRILDNPPGRFPQSLLQYLGTFSREWNRPAPDWLPDSVTGRRLATRWDMNNLQIVIPPPWLYPGNHGQGHAYGKQRFQNGDIKTIFGLKQWVPGTFATGNRFTDPNYYGHWQYDPARNVDQLPVSGDPDFFQVIDYALKQKNGGISPDRATVFAIGAAIIDQYDTDDLRDTPPEGSLTGNTITIIDYLNDGNAFAYAYGIENMSYDDPNINQDRPPFAPYPPTPNYSLLNRRFENVGEFGYARNPLNTTWSGILGFARAASQDTAMLDFFTYNTAANRAGIVNLNTRNAPVLASIIRGAWLHDPGIETLPPNATYLVPQADALAAAQAIVQETRSGGGPVLTRADVARLAEVAGGALNGFPGTTEDEKKQTIARALAEVGQARTWNLMIDVIAQTGSYAPGTANFADATKFIVQGEKRYWLHVALDRDDGTVLGTQLEEVIE